MSLCRAANGARALFRGRSAGGEAAAAHAAVATVARLYSLCLTGGDPRFFDRLGAGKRRVRRSTALTAAFAAVPYPTSAAGRAARGLRRVALFLVVRRLALAKRLPVAEHACRLTFAAAVERTVASAAPALARSADDDRHEWYSTARAQGSKRVIQRRFNVSVPRARVSETVPTLRERSERRSLVQKLAETSGKRPR